MPDDRVPFAGLITSYYTCQQTPLTGNGVDVLWTLHDVDRQTRRQHRRTMMTHRRPHIMPSRAYHLTLDAVQPDALTDAWDVEASMRWLGLSTGQELGVLDDLLAQQSKYLERAKDVAAQKGMTPVSVEPGAPLPPRALPADAETAEL